jgi:hypothetical protein
MMKPPMFLFCFLTLAASCAVCQNVRFNFDKNADFSKFRTYKWVSITNGTPAQGLTDPQIRGAFDAELAKKGLTKVDSETADLLVGYQFGIKKNQKLASYGSGWGYPTGWDVDTWQGASREAPSIIYEGELCLDMYEKLKHTLSWRGVASKTVDLDAKANDRQKHLEKAVKKLMEYYPPVAMVGH